MNYFKLDGPGRWGDYGSILFGGMVIEPFVNAHGQLTLARTGPYCPPISFAGTHVIVTADFGSRLISRFKDLHFRDVAKVKIVYIDWAPWDCAMEWPALMPSTGEPEDYLNLGTHSEVADAGLGELKEVILPVEDGCRVTKYSGYRSQLSLEVSKLEGRDFFAILPATIPVPVVSERGKEFFDQVCPEWVSFKELPTF